ncbi:MAG: type IV pilus modification protein PilV [Xanthomonadales bacterium]|jgi:type IV pilus assembly protein PilV|nr:type IV pilus modification protein PilV [Xanthomonadales bacterium]
MKQHSLVIRKHQGGLSLLEVLIALVVLSIGLVGLAVMHINSLQYVHSAYYRSLASAIALDFEERLWLELADDTVTDCPVLTTSGAAYTSLVADWRTRSTVPAESFPGFGASNLATIRNLTITPGIVATSTFAEMPVTLTWAEGRFDDDGAVTDEGDTETYVYNVRLLCKLSTTGSI